MSGSGRGGLLGRPPRRADPGAEHAASAVDCGHRAIDRRVHHGEAARVVDRPRLQTWGPDETEQLSVPIDYHVGASLGAVALDVDGLLRPDAAAGAAMAALLSRVAAAVRSIRPRMRTSQSLYVSVLAEDGAECDGACYGFGWSPGSAGGPGGHG